MTLTSYLWQTFRILLTFPYLLYRFNPYFSHIMCLRALLLVNDHWMLSLMELSTFYMRLLYLNIFFFRLIFSLVLRISSPLLYTFAVCLFRPLSVFHTHTYMRHCYRFSPANNIANAIKLKRVYSSHSQRACAPICVCAFVGVCEKSERVYALWKKATTTRISPYAIWSALCVYINDECTLLF